MLPPTISAAPTSEITAPKAAMPAASSGSRASIATAHSARDATGAERLHLHPEVGIDLLQGGGREAGDERQRDRRLRPIIAVGV